MFPAVARRPTLTALELAKAMALTASRVMVASTVMVM
jgi:hypothetical protein